MTQIQRTDTKIVTADKSCGAYIQCSCGQSSAQYISKSVFSDINKEDLEEHLRLQGWEETKKGWLCPQCASFATYKGLTRRIRNFLFRRNITSP